MRKKVFLHIGMHKTATTWLQEYFFPSIKCSLSYNDEPSYTFLMNVFRYNMRKEDIEYAKSHFSNLKNDKFFSAEIMCGNLFDGYSNFKTQISVLKEIFSDYDIYIIFVSRLPSEWLVSAYRESFFEHHYCEFDEFLCKSSFLKSNYHTNSIPKMLEFLKFQFGDRVCHLQFEQFKNDRNKFMKELCSFLNASIDVVPRNAPNNVGYSNNAIKILLLLQKYLRSSGAQILLPDPIEFFGKKSIYLIEEKKYRGRLGKVLRKVFYLQRRGNWLRFFMRQLDKMILRRTQQVELRHNFSHELRELDADYIKMLKK